MTTKHAADEHLVWRTAALVRWRCEQHDNVRACWTGGGLATLLARGEGSADRRRRSSGCSASHEAPEKPFGYARRGRRYRLTTMRVRGTNGLGSLVKCGARTWATARLSIEQRARVGFGTGLLIVDELAVWRQRNTNGCGAHHQRLGKVRTVTGVMFGGSRAPATAVGDREKSDRRTLFVGRTWWTGGGGGGQEQLLRRVRRLVRASGRGRRQLDDRGSSGVRR